MEDKKVETFFILYCTKGENVCFCLLFQKLGLEYLLVKTNILFEYLYVQRYV